MSVIGSAVSEYDEEDGPQIGDDLMVRSGGEGEEGEERVCTWNISTVVMVIKKFREKGMD